jgi:GNAT superfamily N-acetyltransferase
VSDSASSPLVSLRPATPGDDALFLEVYTSTREFELQFTEWSETEKAGFCRSQFEAQTAHYHLHYPTAEYSAILVDGTPAGRLYVDRWPREIRIMDIALLPAFRGRGVGGGILKTLQDEARDSGKLLSIHVERFNPALRLYDRLGFRLAEDKGVYLLLHWEPDPVRVT